eukprot:gene9216-1502_t
MGGGGSKASIAIDFSSAIQSVCSDPDAASSPTVLPSKPNFTKSLKAPFGPGLTAASYREQSYTIDCLLTQVKLSKTNQDEILKSISKIAQVNDKHVLRMLGVFPSRKAMFVAFEYCSHTLEEVLNTQGSLLTPKVKAKVLADISDGMAALEDAGIIHGGLCAATCLTDSSASTFKVCPSSNILMPTQKRLTFFPPECESSISSWTSQADAWLFGIFILEVFFHEQLTAVQRSYQDEQDTRSGNTSSPSRRDMLPEWIESFPTDSLPTALKAVLQTCLGVADQRPDFFWLRAEFQTADFRWFDTCDRMHLYSSDDMHSSEVAKDGMLSSGMSNKLHSSGAAFWKEATWKESATRCKWLEMYADECNRSYDRAIERMHTRKNCRSSQRALKQENMANYSHAVPQLPALEASYVRRVCGERHALSLPQIQLADEVRKAQNAENSAALALLEPKPVPEKIRTALFDGVSKEGKGRKQYLQLRQNVPLEERYSFPQTTAQAMNFGLNSILITQQTGPRFGRRRVVAPSFYRKSGIPLTSASTLY